jgi:hypothetical protein
MRSSALPNSRSVNVGPRYMNGSSLCESEEAADRCHLAALADTSHVLLSARWLLDHAVALKRGLLHEAASAENRRRRELRAEYLASLPPPLEEQYADALQRTSTAVHALRAAHGHSAKRSNGINELVARSWRLREELEVTERDQRALLVRLTHARSAKLEARQLKLMAATMTAPEYSEATDRWQRVAPNRIPPLQRGLFRQSGPGAIRFTAASVH